MVKHVLIIILIFLVSCKNCENNNTPIEINNPILLQQIREYKSYCDKINKGKAYIIRVYCREINDSTNKFVISNELNAIAFKMTPYHFKCKVDNFDVFFVMLSGIVENNSYTEKDKNFFRVNENVLLNDIKGYFPIAYKLYKKNNYFTFNYIHDPENLYLIFVHDKLIGKKLKRGMYNE